MLHKKQHEKKFNLLKLTTKSQLMVLYLAALEHLLHCLVAQPARMMVVLNMVLKKVVESLESARTDQMETWPKTDANVVLTTAFLADEEMSQKTLVSVHMDLKQRTSVSTVVVHKDQSLPQLQLIEEKVHLTMVLEAVACKVDSVLQQQTLEPSVVLHEDQMVKELSELVHTDPKSLYADSLASACICLD